jgi:hypothetical protein
MLDYLGSIEKDPEDIDKELIQYFRDYNQSYISQIISELRNENQIQNVYSVSGWNVFHGRGVIDLIKNRIQIDTEIAHKKLLLTKYFIQNEIPLEIVEDI